MRNIVKILWIVVLSIFLFISCNKDEVEPYATSELVKITESVTDNNQFRISLFAVDTLFHGYNDLLFSVEKISSGEKVRNASFALYPEMDMISMRHSAPNEAPGQMANEDDLFEGAVVFIMPDTDEMKWRIKVTLEASGVSDSVWLSIPKVKSLEEPKIVNFISAIDEAKYFVSLVKPFDPKVGINEIEVTVHYKKSMMSFPPDEDVTIEINPQMPSMDHGSPNNVNPIHSANGHYIGKVNFTMTGWWRVYITLKKNGELITDEAYIDITF